MQSLAIRQSNQITLMLDQVLGTDRFDRGPVDIANLALKYSAQTAPESPIREVLERNIPGCMGALVYGESKPRQWTIVSHKDQSDGRKAYTLGHEFGHYVLVL